MPEVRQNGLDSLDRSFKELLGKAPEKRKELHERIADRLKETIDAKIVERLDDSNGKVQGYQEKAVGSGGGYAAVRPVKGRAGANSPGAITNYLEGGHRIRPPTGGKDYRPRINVPYVEGRFFYASASAEAERVALEEAEQFADELADMLEGKL